MKKWSEIKQAIINKLFMDEQEVNNDTENYANKFAYYANECLNQIANSVKPAVKSFQPIVYATGIMGSDFNLEDDTIKYNTTLGDMNTIAPASNTVYIDINSHKRYVYLSGALQEVDNYFTIADTIQMPEDFLSFADMINYLNGQPDPEITYVGDRYIKLNKVGAYNIFYNALYEQITEEYMDDKELPIDISVLNCIPSYVASQILAEDDITRSTVLKNEYELMLSRLDINVMYEANHFKSNGGWY